MISGKVLILLRFCNRFGRCLIPKSQVQGATCESKGGRHLSPASSPGPGRCLAAVALRHGKSRYTGVQPSKSITSFSGKRANLQSCQKRLEVAYMKTSETIVVAKTVQLQEH